MGLFLLDRWRGGLDNYELRNESCGSVEPACGGLGWFWDGGLFHLRRSLRRDMRVLLGKDAKKTVGTLNLPKRGSRYTDRWQKISIKILMMKQR